MTVPRQDIERLHPNQVVSGSGEAALLGAIVNHHGDVVESLDPINFDPPGAFGAAPIDHVAGYDLRRSDLDNTDLTSHGISWSAQPIHRHVHRQVARKPTRVGLAGHWRPPVASGRLPDSGGEMADLLVERDGAVMIVTMNRPDRKNAMTLQMFGRLRDAWREAGVDDDIRCIVLTGAGGDFCAGMDLRGLAGDHGVSDDWDVTATMEAEGTQFIWDGLLKTARPGKPIVAAVEGVAIAGGTEILQGTDIRVAAESARFGVSEVKWSLYPMGGSAVRLARQIGYAEAADMLLTGKHITALEAKAIGLVSRVVPDGTALEHAMQVARTVAANGPLAVEAVVRTLHETPGMTEAEAFAHEDQYSGLVMSSEDAKEGPRAFAEKRSPEFKRH